MNFSRIALVLLTVIVTSFAQLPDISFANGWQQSGSGISYTGETQEMSLTDVGGEYSQTVSYSVSINNPPEILYFSIDAYYKDLVYPGPSWEKARIKVVDADGSTLAANVNIEINPAEEWFTKYVEITGFDNWTSPITFEIVLQNATGEFRARNPRISDVQPASEPYSFPYAYDDSPTVMIDVNLSEKKEFKSDILSTNQHFSWSPYAYDDVELRTLVKEKYPMSNMRFPGGTVGNFYNWETDEYYDDSWTYQSGSRQNLAQKNWKFGYDDFASLSKELSGSATLMFNVMQDDVEKATNRLKDRIASGIDIEWVELGNENYFDAQAFGHVANGDNVVSVENYIAHTEALTAALKEVDSSIKTTVNISELNYNSGWTKEISNKSYYDATTIHKYIYTGGNDFDNYTAEGFFRAYKTMHDMVEEYKEHFPGKPVVLSEWGFLDSPASFLQVVAMADCLIAFSEWANEGTVAQAGIHMMSHSSAYRVGQFFHKVNGTTQFTHLGALYEKMFEVFKGKELYGMNNQSAQLVDGLKAINALVADHGDSIKVLAVNKYPVNTALKLSQDNSDYVDGYTLESMSEDIEIVLDASNGSFLDSKSLWDTTTGTGSAILPPYSINIITIAKKDEVTFQKNIEKEFSIGFRSKGLRLIELNVDENYDLALFDVQGQLIKSSMVSGVTDFELDTSDLAKGKYMLVINGVLQQENQILVK